MNNNELTLYDKIINNIPSYVKNSLSAIGVVIFTALVLYLFHTVATSYRLALYTEIGAPYFTQTINLWSFYLFHVDLLLIVIVSLIFFIGFYILGGLGAVSPKKDHIYEYLIYNLFLALVVFAFFISVKDNGWLSYIVSVIVFTVIMSVLQYRSDKAKQPKDNNSTELKDNSSIVSKYKLVAYSIILFIVPIVLFYPFVGIFSFNTYFANSFGRDNGQILLESIKNDEYIDKKEGAIIKSSGEYVYPLSCDSLCFIVKKNENNELFFEFIDSKDLIFTRS